MTNEELEALEKLEKAATPGPWYGCFDYIVTADDEPIAEYFGDEDCEFIVLLRDAAPALIAAGRENAKLRERVEWLEFRSKVLDTTEAEDVRQLQAENARLRAVVEAARAMHDAGVDPRNGPAGKALAELALALSALDAKETP